MEKDTPGPIFYIHEKVNETEHDKLVRSLEKNAEKLTGVRQVADDVKVRKSLCYSCRYASIRRRVQDNDNSILCGALPGYSTVQGDVAECSDYRAFTALSLDQMARMAWLIDVRDHLRDGYR